MIRIGKIVATHGINGALVLTHVVGKSTWLKKEQVLLIEMNRGSYIPYFVKNCKPVNAEEYIVSLEDIDKVESGKKLISKQVYVEESLLAGFEKQSPLLWIGFKLIDKNKGQIGEIEDVMQTGNQWIAKVTYQNNEALIPLIDETIDDLNIKTKTIRVTLPEGLLEIYLK